MAQRSHGNGQHQLNRQDVFATLEALHEHPARPAESIVFLDLRAYVGVVGSGHQFLFVREVGEEKLGGLREFSPEKLLARPVQHRIMEAVHGT
jgi:hypothetical protein